MPHRVRALAAVLFIGSAPTPALSSPPGAGQQPCLRLCEHETTTLQNRDCLLADEKTALQQLEAEIAAATKSFGDNAEALAAFNDAQKAWLAYYAADCETVRIAWAGGFEQRNAMAFCRVDHIRRRAFDIWLRYHLESLPKPGLVCNDLWPDA